MFHRKTAVGLVLFCLIAVPLSGCARRHATRVQLPGAAATASKGQKSLRPGEAARKMRDAIRSLKDKISPGDRASGAREQPSAEAPSEAPGASGAIAGPSTKPGQVGTSGAWSVETRHPSPPAAGPSAGGKSGAAPRGRLLSRAGQAVRQVGGGSWGGVLALCVIALALVAAAFAVRRSRHA